MSALAYNPLIDGVSYTSPGMSSSRSTYAGTPQPVATGTTASVQGMAPLTGRHNTPLHLAMLGVLAILVLWGLRALGFEFVATGRVGR